MTVTRAAIARMRQCLEENDLSGAYTACKEMIAAHPSERRWVIQLADILHRQGNHRDALNVLDPMIRANLEDPDLWLLAGIVLGSLGRLDEARDALHRADAAGPGRAETLAELGRAYRRTGNLAEAIGYYDKAVAHDPTNARILTNRGTAHQRLNRLDRARADFTRALNLRPDHATARFNLGLLDLLEGRFRDGWTGYRWRNKLSTRVLPDRQLPEWDGTPLAGRTLIVRLEQGFGDAIMFARFLPMIDKAGGRVIVSGRAPVLPVIATVTGVDDVHDRDAPLPPGDAEIFIGDLPRLFDVDADSLPARVPYVHVPAEKFFDIGPRGAACRVGLVWGGSPSHLFDAERSIPADLLAPLTENPELALFSLQTGDRAAELQAAPFAPRVTDLAPRLTDFAATAAAIQQLDLIVSADTAVAHLAGALGKPVWILIPFVPDWRWQRDREDSPWYPTARLFRQTRPGDWAEVVGRIAAALPQALPVRTGGRYKPGMDDNRARLAAAVERHRAGDLDGARDIYRAILADEPRHADALHLLGLTHHQKGDYRRAIDLIEKALDAAPNTASFLGNLGEAYRMAGNLAAAEEKLRAAIGQDARQANALNSLGILLRQQTKFDEAIAMYRQALALEPDNGAFHMNLAGALRDIGDMVAAREEAARAVELSPGSAGAHNTYGNILKDLGEIDGAVAAYRKALEIDPAYGHPYWNLATSRRYGPDDRQEIAAFEKTHRRQDVPRETHIEVAFALGKIHDDLGEYDNAFRYFEEANRLRRPPFDPRAYIDYVDQQIALYTKEFFAARRGFGVNDETPVFIVGLIRSGTSLVEQIVASHPAAAGAGELRDIALATEALAARTETPYPAAAARIDATGAQDMGRAYLAGLRKRFPAAARVTDKMPTNFLHLGFIQLLLPKARIVHCRRHPMDACLSAYVQNFAEPPPFASDLTGLGVYHRHYERLMAHWRETIDLPIHDIDYESMVENPEAESRRLIEFCGLDWDDACLTPHETRRDVRTASSWQVRQPIYRSSIARWRHYEKHLGPLKAALGWRDEEGETR